MSRRGADQKQPPQEQDNAASQGAASQGAAASGDGDEEPGSFLPICLACSLAPSIIPRQPPLPVRNLVYKKPNFIFLFMSLPFFVPNISSVFKPGADAVLELEIFGISFVSVKCRLPLSPSSLPICNIYEYVRFRPLEEHEGRCCGRRWFTREDTAKGSRHFLAPSPYFCSLWRAIHILVIGSAAIHAKLKGCETYACPEHGPCRCCSCCCCGVLYLRCSASPCLQAQTAAPTSLSHKFFTYSASRARKDSQKRYSTPSSSTALIPLELILSSQ